ncbi:hypothetical protein EHS25_003699 [Saitozyma podzolica]|uniref:Proteasome assembly chaperone 2 n=1 Tax=Saitozyma podzolica TaxID=1890683 RepID=A0A427Y378_9TREE|nr:hypothetical protein EHS25_003699 [Saitozyma podzolica]
MSTFYPVQGFSPASFEGKVLVLPAVSLANLPQLAADLLITSLNLVRVGWIGKGDTVVPFFGAGEDKDEVLTGGLEVYGRAEGEVFVVQQRSPTIKTQKDAHVELLREFITSNKLGYTLILTSLDAANQDDAQLLTPHQHILPPSSASSASDGIAKRIESSLRPLQLHLSEQPISPPPSSSSSNTPYPPFLPSAGLTRRLLASLNDDPAKPAHATITAWCVEGDNRGDARALADTALKVLGIDDVTVREPSSWAGLFGALGGWSGGLGSDAELYG